MYNKKQIEIVDYFKYLGVPFTPNCKFTECRKYVVNQARKAIYLILKKARIQKLPIDVQLDLFHNMVLPILIYSSKVWGIENYDLIIKLHVKFCKHILHCKTSTPTCMVYGEPGQIPPSIEIKCRISSKNGILILIHLKNVVVIVCLTDFALEPYQLTLSYNNRITLCKFRVSDHELPIELGRHLNIHKEERYCNLCQQGKIGNEYHVLLECNTLVIIRRKYMSKMYHTNHSNWKFKKLS